MMQNATSEQLLSNVWTLKYAPTTIDDLLLSEENRQFFSSLTGLNNNLLFISSPGGGKTSTAKILSKKFSPFSYIYINASEENGIDVVRTKISNFISIQSFDGNPKVVILDEIDGATTNFQQALRGVMEEYLEDVKFILTGNFKHKILEAIQSRCQTFDFSLNIKDVFARMIYILKQEKITILEEDKKALVTLLKSHFPDIRKTINELQKCCITGKFIPNIKKEETLSSTIVERLKNKTNVWEIRKYVLAHEQDFNSDYHFLMKKLFDHYVLEENAGKVLLIVDAMYKHSIVADAEVNFAGLLINLAK